MANTRSLSVFNFNSDANKFEDYLHTLTIHGYIANHGVDLITNHIIFLSAIHYRICKHDSLADSRMLIGLCCGRGYCTRETTAGRRQ
jgi:hypothetical protein